MHAFIVKKQCYSLPWAMNNQLWFVSNAATHLQADKCIGTYHTYTLCKQLTSTVELGVLVPYPEEGREAKDHRRPSLHNRERERDREKEREGKEEEEEEDEFYH